MKRNYAQAAFRLTRFLIALLQAKAEARRLGLINGEYDRDKLRRAKWVHDQCKRISNRIGMSINTIGTPPTAGILASNHLSYLDIITYGSIQPMVFLSKEEVRSWPIIGPLTEIGGTLFVKRERTQKVGAVADHFKRIVDEGILLVLFPEGTSSDGSKVLPFFSPLMQPFIDHQWAITPAAIQYQATNGVPGHDVCYWGDMNFGPHLFKLLSLPSVTATARFGNPLKPGSNRKLLAKRLHTEITELHLNKVA